MIKNLTTSVDLFTAALSQTTVTISIDGNLEYAGIIREYCDNYVKVNDVFYLQSKYEFSVVTRS
ncbi:hypothetical protein [Paenibacillus qinlingensis]|uniref:hypothetical protein n=1 Tax=Paenibacillus qinlingensis TaxID=1837343 RepID=UPI001562FAB0|nr:hypothetical protein [Paenibacillus qinlingensis]NQX61831.1 hypothetical protein [Paenibacillus qinlingensis]